MVVKSHGKTYGELLKDIKSNIDVDRLDVKIKNIRKAGKWDIMFEVQGQRSKVNILNMDIKKRVDNASEIKIHSKENFLHIDDIAPTIDTNKVLDAIKRAIGPSKNGHVEVKFLRVNVGSHGGC